MFSHNLIFKISTLTVFIIAPLNIKFKLFLVGAIKLKDFSCSSCCPALFSSPDGIVKVHERSSLLHTLSYIIRCLLPEQETFIITNAHLTNYLSIISSDEENDERGRANCAKVQNMPMSLMTVETFVEEKDILYREIVTKRRKGVNFLIAPETSEEVVACVTKVEKILESMRSLRTSFWQPNVVFVWPKVLKNFPANDSNTLTQTIISFPGDQLFQSWFGNWKPQFSFDSSILFIFTVQKGSSSRSKANLHLSLWEVYNLKNKFIIERIRKRSSSYQESNKVCNDRKDGSLSLPMRQLNSYIFLERYMRRGNMQLVQLVASVKDTTTSSDWIKIEFNKDGTVVLQNGLAVSIFNDMKVMLNFSEVVMIGNGEETPKLPKDSCLPLPPKKKRKGFPDIIINQETMTPTRASMSSFLQPTYYGTYLAFFKQPSASTIRNIVSAPFTRTLWITFIVTWLVIIVSVYMWWGLSSRNILESSGDLNFVDEIGLWTVAAICQKSWYQCPSTSIFKSIFYIGSLMALVCYAAYSAMIVSFLTVTVLPVKSLKDLAEYQYRFTAHERSEATLLLAEKLIDTFKLSQKVLLVDTENEISHIFKLHHAFLAYPDLFYSTAAKQNFTQEFICSNVSTVQAQNMPYKSAMSVPKGSQFREIFSQKLLRIMERGLNHRYTNVYENSKSISCIKNIYDSEKGKLQIDPVNFTDVLIAFLVIFIGWAAACLIVSAEVVHKRPKFLYIR